MAIKLSEAKESLKILKRDISDIDDIVGDTFVQWADFANREIYDYIRGINNTRFVLDETYINLTGSQALPSDLLSFNGQNLGFHVLDSNNQPTTERLSQLNYGENKRGFYLDGDNVVFPQEVKCILRYLPEPTTLTSEDDYFTVDGTATGIEIIPRHYLQALRDDLNRYYSQWDETDESLADFRFSRTLSAMQKRIGRSSQARRIPRFNQYY